MLSALDLALSCLAPLWGLVLLVKYKPALVSCFAVLSLSVFITASGILQLTNAKDAEQVLQTCLYAHLGASVICLAHRYKGYSLVLAGLLFSATVLGSTIPFVHAIPAIIPPLLFLLFTLSTLPLLAHISKIRTIPAITQVPLPSPAASSVASLPSESHEMVSSCSTYKQPPPASTDSGPTAVDVESPATGIRHRAQIIQMRSRNIILTLLISQFFTLLSLVLALVPHSQVIKSIQTFLIVLAICGTMFAITLHGHTPSIPPNTLPSTRISISVSIFKRQDQPNTVFPNSNPDHHSTASTHKARAKPHSSDNTHHHGVNIGDCHPHSPSWNDNCLYSQPGKCRTHAQLGLALGLSSGLEGSSGGGGGVRRFQWFRKIFGVKEGEEGPISLKNLHHPQNSTAQNQCHIRFASSSSSFSSSPLYNQNDFHSHPRVLTSMGISGHEEKKFDDIEDEGVELPVLLSKARLDSTAVGQLPSPPDTPRARIHSSTTTAPYLRPHHPTTYHQEPNHVTSSVAAAVADNDENKEAEQVRIGMVTPAEKPNLTIRDIFVDAEQYEEACERGEIIDSAVSEPGHGSREYFDLREEDRIGKSSEMLVSSSSSESRCQTPTPVLRSPTFSNPSSWMMKTTNNCKQPMKSRSMMSLSLSFGSGSGSAPATGTRSHRTPTLLWKGAEKLKEKLKRPLGGHGRALSLSQSSTLSYSVKKEEGLDFVLEEGEEVNESRKDRGRGEEHHHTRTGSAWSSLAQMSPTFTFSPNVPAMESNGSEREPSPKPKLKLKSLTSSNLHQADVLTSSISNKKKREQTPTPLSGSSSEHQHQQPMSDTADFVDLTDPFASPTPGFTLPKWVANNGSSVTAGSVGLGVGGNWNGSVSDVGHGGYYSSTSGVGGGASSSWCHDDGGGSEEVYVNQEKESGAYTTTKTIWNVPSKAAKSRSSAQWGKLPPVPPLPSSSFSDQGYYNYDGLKKKREATAKRTRPSRRRPDSPMPMKMMLSGTTSRGLTRVVDSASEDHTIREGEREILERPGSPVPPSPSSSPLTLATAMELGIRRELGDTRALRSAVVRDNDIDVLGSGRLQKQKTIDSNTKNNLNNSPTRITRSDTKISGVRSRRGRNGSPVPIPFRSNKSRRGEINVDIGGAGGVLKEEKGGEDLDVGDGLDLEEVLLAQRLLRRLNSDEGGV